jgi:hypothetical protein
MFLSSTFFKFYTGCAGPKLTDWGVRKNKSLCLYNCVPAKPSSICFGMHVIHGPPFQSVIHEAGLSVIRYYTWRALVLGSNAGPPVRELARWTTRPHRRPGDDIVESSTIGASLCCNSSCSKVQNLDNSYPNIVWFRGLVKNQRQMQN